MNGKEETIMISMILAVHNNLSYTQHCVAVLQDNFAPDEYELIVVDDGSADGTAEWLKGNGVQFLRHEEARGIAAARNLGASAAKGDAFLFLEADVWLTHAALEEMVACVNRDARVGIVGCLSNCDEYGCGLFQDAADYEGYEGYKAFAQRVANDARQSAKRDCPAIFATAFAMLITRPAWFALGGFDESACGKSVGADVDFSLRAWQAGYCVVRAKGAYVHRIRPVWNGTAEGLEQETMCGRMWFKRKWGFEINYSCNVRTELLQFVQPKQASPSVLEVGCACGGNFMLLREKFPDITCCGIELDDRSAAVANCFGQIFNMDVETLDMPEWENQFDAVILGDVLEHLYDPWQTVRHMYRVTRPGGRIIVSVPNITHISIFDMMLSGQWKYAAAGILDHTHLRFFTQATAKEMVESAGYRVVTLASVSVIEGEEQERLKEILRPLLRADAPSYQLDAYQWVIVGEKAEA